MASLSGTILVTGGMGFIGSNFSSPLSLVTPKLARLAAIGGFRGWERMVRRFITDERLQPVWGERLTRILLHAANPAMQDTWIWQVSKA